MNAPERHFSSCVAGIRFLANPDCARLRFLSRLEELDMPACIVTTGDLDEGHGISFSLRSDCLNEWVPHYDTTRLSGTLNFCPTESDDDLEREILLAMLAGPRAFEYPNHEEFAAAVRIRKNIVTAARRTQMNFRTSDAERPADCWRYDEDRGFIIQPGKALADALEKATQPHIAGRPYAFSCYRATEYVILLAIAKELATTNPALLKALQRQWETEAIKSGRFHDVFLFEYGSMSDPLPPGYYVPGDRVWFRNPDEHSSDVSGYEGSWVFYLGGGLFSNFWKRDQPYSLVTKCVEIFHWRHGTYLDSSGDLRMDESVVDSHVSSTLDDHEETQRIFHRMMRLRDPQGIYAEGGCIDASREFPRWVCPGTAEIKLSNG